MTILDRYLLRRYWHVFLLGCASLFGLYFVIDVFTNVTDFLDQPVSTWTMLAGMAHYYAYRACYFFGLVGGTMEVIAAMTTMALVQKNGELNPVLSAGVSTFRLIRPLFIGAAIVNVLILLNQEFIIPQIALELQQNAGSSSDVTEVEPIMDHATQILIAGKRMNLRSRKIEEAEFVLRPPEIAERLVTIAAREAIPLQPTQSRRAGWLLKGTTVAYDSLPLTDMGRKYVRPGKSEGEIFVRTDVGFDRLYNRDKHYEYLSTRELMRRIHNRSFTNLSISRQSLYLHSRLTKPFLTLIVVAVGIPFVVRKESLSLLSNLGLCGVVMACMMGMNELFLYLGRVNLVSAELAVWLPIIIWGSAAAWFSGLVRT
jgi:lipopolysaccharide export system permease protein